MRKVTPGSPGAGALALACVLMTLVGILAAFVPANMTVLRDEG
jgi:hypothetical protein